MTPLFRRRASLDDFAEAIRPELDALPSPSPSAELRGRILASRAAGERVILPSPPARTPAPTRALLAAAIAAAALVVVVPLALQRERESARAADLASPGFFGHPALAQTAPSLPAALPPVHAAAGRNYRPVDLLYRRTSRAADGRVIASSTLSFSLRADTLDGERAWRLVSTRPERVRGKAQIPVETLYVAQADPHRMLRRSIHVAPYSRYARINVQQRFRGSHLTGRMTTEGPSIGAGRGIDRRLPAAAAPFLSELAAPVFFMPVAMDRGWTGSASLLGWAVRDDDVLVPLSFRVQGQETLATPIGRFECWRLSIRFAGREILYWVRKSDGLAVRSADYSNPTGEVREMMLVDERTDTP